MNPVTMKFLGMLSFWLLAFFLAWVPLVYVPKVKLRRKVRRLRVGNQYVLDGKDPFKQTRVVIDEIKGGYVAYRWIFKRDGEADRLSGIDSTKAETFARLYEEDAKPGDAP